LQVGKLAFWQSPLKRIGELVAQFRFIPQRLAMRFIPRGEHGRGLLKRQTKFDQATRGGKSGGVSTAASDGGWHLGEIHGGALFKEFHRRRWWMISS
jgi:hypothetical protein